MFISKKSLVIFLTLIVVIGAFLRFYQLGQVPPSPDWDEVALGYDGYSLIETGRDEFGKYLPVVLRSFDDYKPALYAYLTIPSILFSGLNVWAVRFPSAFFGTLSIIAVFFLVRELFERYKHKNIFALLSSFLFAISPWSIQFSRIGFESNVGVAFNIFTALFFLKGLKKPWLLSVSAFFAGLNLYVYQSEKVFTPFFVLLLILIYREELFILSKKYLYTALITGIIVVLPMIAYIAVDSSSLLRVKGTSIFSYQTELLGPNIERLERDYQNNNRLGLVLDNRRVVYAKTIVEGYISHFNPNWLFVTGDIARHHAPNMGLLYLFEFPLILIGIYCLLFGNFSKKTKLLIFGWFLLAPLPASVTTGVPHAVRTLNFLPTWHIFSALGLIIAVAHINKLKRIRYLLYLIFFFIFSFNFSYYLNQYFVQQNYYHSQDWQYGYQQAIEEIKPIQDQYEKIVISDKQPMDKSYMFFLFYLKYPPKEYQKAGQTTGSFESHQSFEKYEFRPINWAEDSLEKNRLYIGNPEEIPEQAAFKTIYNLDNTPAIRIADTK